MEQEFNNQEQLPKQNNSSKKRQYMLIAGPLILLIALVGITYSFFNYTRTGTANTFGTGRIYFNSDQGNTLNITNAFPMTSTQANAPNANLDTVTLSISGDTTYVNGEEFEITLTDINNTVNGKSIPLNYIATYTATNENSIGTSSDTYWSARESKNANIYLLNGTGEVEEGKQVLVGYVDNEGNGINGTLTIKAYIDADRIAISDTYYENVTATPTPTGPNDQYGTTSEWVDGRTVLTTDEWNSFQNSQTPISFKIKAVSQEGIWVRDPLAGIIASCPGCKFIYTTTTMYPTWHNTLSSIVPETPTVLNSGLSDDYEEVVANSGYNYFYGVKLNNNNEIERAYVCGIKGNTPFCIEATDSSLPESSTIYAANRSLLQSSALWNNSCTTSNAGTDAETINCADDDIVVDMGYSSVYIVDPNEGYEGLFISRGTMNYGVLD